MRDFKKPFKEMGRMLLFLLILTGLLAGLSRQVMEIAKHNDGLVQERNKTLVKLQNEE